MPDDALANAVKELARVVGLLAADVAALGTGCREGTTCHPVIVDYGRALGCEKCDRRVIPKGSGNRIGGPL